MWQPMGTLSRLPNKEFTEVLLCRAVNTSSFFRKRIMVGSWFKKKKKVYKRHVLETTRDIVVSAASYMISRMSFNVGAHKTEDPLGFRSCEL